MDARLESYTSPIKVDGCRSVGANVTVMQMLAMSNDSNARARYFALLHGQMKVTVESNYLKQESCKSHFGAFQATNSEPAK